MSNFVKPQFPIKFTNTYIYPLTTSDQVIFPNRTRLEDNLNELPLFSESNKIVNGIHAWIAISNTKKGVF